MICTILRISLLLLLTEPGPLTHGWDKPTVRVSMTTPAKPVTKGMEFSITCRVATVEPYGFGSRRPARSSWEGVKVRRLVLLKRTFHGDNSWRKLQAATCNVSCDGKEITRQISTGLTVVCRRNMVLTNGFSKLEGSVDERGVMLPVIQRRLPMRPRRSRVKIVTLTATVARASCHRVGSYQCLAYVQYRDTYKTVVSEAQTVILSSMEKCSWSCFPLQHSCVTISQEPETWQRAQENCVAGHGSLVTIAHVQENKFLASLLVHLARPGNEEFFIGLSDRKSEGRFQWVSGSKANFRFWEKGQPDDDFQNGDCVVLTPITGTWRDTYCSRRLPYVCERRLKNEPLLSYYSAQQGCPREALEYHNICYQRGTNALSRQEARMSCYIKGAQLAEFPSWEHYIYVTTWLADFKGNYYLGLKASTKKNVFVRWDSRSLAHVQDWRDQRSQREQCVALNVSDRSYRYQDVTCSNSFHFICQKYLVYETPNPTFIF